MRATSASDAPNENRKIHSERIRRRSQSRNLAAPPELHK